MKHAAATTTSSSAFVHQLLIYTLVLMCTGGSAGVGVVWLRHKISTTAASIQRDEQRIREIERRLAETAVAIEEEQTPTVLEQRNRQWGLGLVKVTDAQVVRVKEDPKVLLASKRNEGLFNDGGTLVKFQLAAH